MNICEDCGAFLRFVNDFHNCAKPKVCKDCGIEHAQYECQRCFGVYCSECREPFLKNKELICMCCF